MEHFKTSILDLIIETSTNLPPDVRRALARAMEQEDASSQSGVALQMIAQNVDMACDHSGPICQDTGMLTFQILTPIGANQIVMKKQIREAVAEATKLGKLRPNSVDSITGKNSGDNLGTGTPVFHFEQHEKDEIEVRLLLKGGGCENKNIQYSLPMELDHLGRADRTLDGVRKCIMHAVWQAQGHGCAVGGLGVAIGSGRASGYAHAKEQLFRSLDDINAEPQLAALEARILKDANDLGIGTMGFGGRVSLIGCKIGSFNRLPASFFVSVAYDCWAFRRLGVVLDGKSGSVKRWLYKEEGPVVKLAKKEGLPATGREVRLTTPLSEEQVRSLRVGDVVLLSGAVHTGRDMIHHHLTTHDSPVPLDGEVIYHCGPVAIKESSGWSMRAAGPTTSSREEPYQGDIIKKFKVRAVIGKGGMGSKTLSALKDVGAVYLNAIGGAAQFYSNCITKVDGVDFLEFGTPEAMWHLRVKDFPAIVTMDAHGHSLHADVEKATGEKLATFREPANT